MGSPRAGVRKTMIRPLIGALALLALAAPAASAQDAEIFATNNTAVITHPADPRLQDRLRGFANQVERIIDEGGGKARGPEPPALVFAGRTGVWRDAPGAGPSARRARRRSAPRAPERLSGRAVTPARHLLLVASFGD